MGLTITPWSKRKQKFLASLRRKKHRIAELQFVIEGDKIVQEYLRWAKPQSSLVIACTDPWFQSNADLIEVDAELSILTAAEIRAVSAFKTPPEVILVAPIIEVERPEKLASEFKGVYLDDVQDPGNVGTIIRTAAWFGFDTVIRSSGSADFYNPKVIQASMGGFLNLDLINDDLSQWRAQFDHIEIVGTTLNAASHYQSLSLTKPAIIVIGHEGKGMRSETVALLDTSIHIPGSGTVESLNASVAFAVIASHLASK